MNGAESPALAALAAWVWAGRRWRVLALSSSVAVLVGVGFVLSVDVADQTQDLVNRATDTPDIAPKDRADLVRNAYAYQADNLTRIWTAIIASLSGVAAVTAGVIAWRDLQAAQAKLDVDRAGQITDRFSRAIDQLGSARTDPSGQPVANLEVRLGAIYALERLARDSPRDHWTVMEVLTAYVRQNAHRTASPAGPPTSSTPPPLRTDIQAILTVIGRRIRSLSRPELTGLDLHETDLRLADLRNAHLEGALLVGTFLHGAHLEDARLEGASLAGAHLDGASLLGTHLEHAALTGAHLEGAGCTTAYLEGADLTDANLERAVLLEAHLERATLRRAHLAGAILANAHLNGAILEGARLEQARSSDLQEQVYSAFRHGESAVLPSDWPASWRARFETS